MNGKKELVILLGILSIILIKLIFTFSVNEIVITNYNNNRYREDLIKILKITNMNESYIVYYNEGNILNKEKKYDEALISYKKALKRNPPTKRKCDIYINMSITMIQMINTTNKDEILNQLKEARENLYNNHCADENDSSGESQDAENLENDIRNQEEQTENGSGTGNQGDEKEKEKEKETDEDKSLENQLQEINKGASENRQQEMDEYKNLGNYQYYTGKNW